MRKFHKSWHIYGLYPNPKKASIGYIMILMLVSLSLQAQHESSPDFMRSTGKIYVVAAVTIVILLSIFVYLILLDRKITRLEKRHKNE